MRLADINSLSVEMLSVELIRCCGSSKWVKQMITARPFIGESDLFEAAEKIWYSCLPSDWLQAFSHHPKIGEKKNLGKKFASTKEWASSEQKGVDSASLATLDTLVKLNQDYEKRFGYIFIVYATGKSAGEMLDLLRSRITNSPEEEMKIAMGEQNKITKLRLQKLLS